MFTRLRGAWVCHGAPYSGGLSGSGPRGRVFPQCDNMTQA